MREVWRPVPGYERYEVSNMGRMRSYVVPKSCVLRERPKLMRTFLVAGYPAINIRSSGKKKYRRESVHVLLLEAFVGPRPAKLEAAHLDGNRRNCTLNNLVWVTRKENHSHKILHGTTNRGVNSGTAKLTEAKVRYIRRNYPVKKLTYFANKFGVCFQTVWDVVSRSSWSHVT